MEKQIYTWAQFDEDIPKIAEWAKERHFQSVYGIPRGGLVIAVALSHALDIPVIISKNDITKRTLIVDDIVDTGGTMERLLASLGTGFKTASIFFKPGARFTPDHYIREKTLFVKFPWETLRSARYDGTPQN